MDLLTAVAAWIAAVLLVLILDQVLIWRLKAQNQKLKDHIAVLNALNAKDSVDWEPK